MLPQLLSHSPSSTGIGSSSWRCPFSSRMRKLVGLDKKTGDLIINCHHRQNRINLGKNICIDCKLKQIQVVRNKGNYQTNTFPPPIPRFNNTPSLQASLSKQYRGMERVTVTELLRAQCSLLLVSSHTIFLLWCTVSPWATVLQENLLLRGLLSTGHKCSQEPTPAQAFHGLQLASGYLHLMYRGDLHGLQWIPALPWSSSSSTSSFSGLGFPCHVSHSFLFYPPLPVQCFLSFLKSVSLEVPPAWLMGPALP